MCRRDTEWLERKPQSCCERVPRGKPFADSWAFRSRRVCLPTLRPAGLSCRQGLNSGSKMRSCQGPFFDSLECQGLVTPPRSRQRGTCSNGTLGATARRSCLSPSCMAPAHRTGTCPSVWKTKEAVLHLPSQGIPSNCLQIRLDSCVVCSIGRV